MLLAFLEDHSSLTAASLVASAAALERELPADYGVKGPDYAEYLANLLGGQSTTGEPGTPQGLEDVGLDHLGLLRATKQSRRWDETIAWVDDRCARLAEGARQALSSIEGGRRSCGLQLSSSRDHAARGDWLSLDAEIFPAPLITYERTRSVLAELRACEAVACIEAYQRDHGGYPTSLQDLVPGYMPSVPVDPWTGTAMGYSRVGAKYTLYCTELELDRLGNANVVKRVTYVPRPE